MKTTTQVKLRPSRRHLRPVALAAAAQGLESQEASLAPRASRAEDEATESKKGSEKQREVGVNDCLKVVLLHNISLKLLYVKVIVKKTIVRRTARSLALRRDKIFELTRASGDRRREGAGAWRGGAQHAYHAAFSRMPEARFG